MRMRIIVDSATPDEVYDLTVAFQRTAQRCAVPSQTTNQPVVTVVGTGMGWESPALTTYHADALVTTYIQLRDEHKRRAL